MSNITLPSEVVKGSHSAPVWFIKAWAEKEIELAKYMKDEKVPIKLFVDRSDKSQDEQDRLIQELEILARRNPKIIKIMDMNNSTIDYLWAKLRYENWNTFGVEVHLGYDQKGKQILVMDIRDEENPLLKMFKGR